MLYIKRGIIVNNLIFESNIPFLLKILFKNKFIKVYLSYITLYELLFESSEKLSISFDKFEFKKSYYNIFIIELYICKDFFYQIKT